MSNVYTKTKDLKTIFVYQNYNFERNIKTSMVMMVQFLIFPNALFKKWS